MIVVYILMFAIAIVIFSIPILNHKGKDEVALMIGATYINGFPDIESGSRIILKIKNDITTISKGLSFAKEIRKQDLINAEIMSERQITQEVSLGKLLIFGTLAFGMKENTVINVNYLVLTYKDNEKSRQIILQVDNNLENSTKTIRKYIGIA